MDIDNIIDEVLEKGGPGSGRKGSTRGVDTRIIYSKDRSKYKIGSDGEWKEAKNIKPKRLNQKIKVSEFKPNKHTEAKESKRLKDKYKVKKSEENNMSKSIEEQIEQMADQMEKSTQDPSEAIKETIKELGAEGLKKAMPSLSDEQKELLKSVIEDMNKAVEMDDSYAADRKREDIQDTKYDTEFADDDKDEELVKPEAAQVSHQGGSKAEGESPWEGQVIKSELAAIRDQIIKSYEDAGLEYTDELVKGMMKKKYMEKMSAKEDEKKDKKIAEKEAKEEVKEHEQKMHKKDMKKADSLVETRKAQEKDLGDGMAAAKLPEEDQTGDTKQITEGESRAKDEKVKDLENDPEETADEVKCPEGKMKKSVSWEDPNALLKANTLGRNHHFNVNNYYDNALNKSYMSKMMKMCKAGMAKKEIKEKMGEEYKEDAYKACMEKMGKMKKSEEPAKKEDLNDIIEKGQDLSYDDYRTGVELSKHKTNGNQSSFNDVDMADAFNMTEEELKEILGE